MTHLSETQVRLDGHTTSPHCLTTLHCPLSMAVGGVLAVGEPNFSGRPGSWHLVQCCKGPPAPSLTHWAGWTAWHSLQQPGQHCCAKLQVLPDLRGAVHLLAQGLQGALILWASRGSAITLPRGNHSISLPQWYTQETWGSDKTGTFFFFRKKNKRTT